MSFVRLATVLAFAAAMFLSLPTLEAQNNAVVPGANITTEGTGTTQAIFLTGTDSTVQLFVDSTELTNFVTGDQINGLSFRLDAAQTTNASISYTQFDIEFSVADANSTMQGLLASTTFTTNQGSVPTVVRSGALTISAGAITDGSSPNSFSYVIPFTTPYTYTAGDDIVITVRVGGLTGAATILDTVPTNQAHLIDWQGNFSSSSATVSTSTIIAAPVIELVSEPEMDLVFASTPVSNGGTIGLGNFGNHGSAYTHTISIENNGVEDLTIATPVSAPGSLTNCTATISSQPDATVIGGNSTGIDVEIKPSAPGLYSCTVTISSNDRDEGTYVFTITGTAAGPAPEMDVFRDTSAIADGGTDNVGDVDFGVTQTLTFRIENNGLATLNLASAPLVTLTTGVNITSVTISTEPTGTILSATSTTFVINYVTTAAGSWNLYVSIGSDDADESPYTWTVSGTSTNQGSTGGGGDDDESCSTQGTEGSNWLVLLGVISALTLAVRVRRSRTAS